MVRPPLRTTRDLASFVDPGPAASFLRADKSTWRVVVAQVFETLTNPASRPDAVREAVGELQILANAADEIAAEVKRELDQP